MDDNPYASPQMLEPEPLSATVIEPLRPLTLRDVITSFLKWTVICGISAAPSFFFANGFHQRSEHVAAMLAGILVFIVGYTIAECADPIRRFRQRPFVRGTMRVGYGTRIAISILFPIGGFVDLFMGIFTTTIMESLLKVPGTVVFGPNEDGESVPFYFFATTLLQGVLLNLLLFIYMLGVYGFMQLWGRTRRRKPLPASVKIEPDFGP